MVYTREMLTSFKQIFSRPKNFFLTILTMILVFFVLRIIPIYEILWNSFRIPGLSLSRKFEIFFEYTFLVFFKLHTLEQFLTLVLVFLTSINVILFVIYAKRQRRLFSGKSFLASISGIILGLFGIGCISCGVLILAPLISFIGLGSYVGGITQYALALSFAGVILVSLSNIYLLHQLEKPNVC